MNETGSTHREALRNTDVSDAHGEAALLLVESLIHELVDQDIISVGEAIDVVEIAVDAQIEVVIDQSGAPPAGGGPVTLLQAIGASLLHDLPDDAS